MIKKSRIMLLYIPIVAAIFSFIGNVNAQYVCDLNDDRIHDERDELKLRVYILADNIPEKGTPQFELFDCNSDGKVDDDDRNYLVQYLYDSEDKIEVNGIYEVYENYDNSPTLSCGKGLVKKIPSLIPRVVSIAYTIIQIAVPVILVIMGSLDLFKGITAQREDEIKKGQQLFVKRLIAAALVFFVFAIVKILISFVADETGNSILECAECFLENNCN